MAIVGWRRVTSDNPCDFCAMLAAQGAVYNAEETADFEAHDNCSCTAEPVWGREREPREVQVLQDAWERVTQGLSGKQAVVAWRVYWRDKQRREAFSPERLGKLSDDELLDLFADVSRKRDLDEDALRAVDDELLRREAAAGRPSPGREDDTPEQRRVDELLASGRTLESAMAEVYDLDEAAFRRAVLADTIDQQRKVGESRDAAARRLYDDQVHIQYLQAEDWTRGNLLNRAGRSAGIDPVTLFSGTRARARKYASEELMRFWDEQSPRQTLTEFKAAVLGRASDLSAAGRLAGGNERDFGL